MVIMSSAVLTDITFSCDIIFDMADMVIFSVMGCSKSLAMSGENIETKKWATFLFSFMASLISRNDLGCKIDVQSTTVPCSRYNFIFLNIGVSCYEESPHGFFIILILFSFNAVLFFGNLTKDLFACFVSGFTDVIPFTIPIL